MAQKIDFIRAGSLDTLAAEFAEYVKQYAVDSNYVVTPIGFIVVGTSFVLALSVDATHKRVFQEPPLPESAINEG